MTTYKKYLSLIITSVIIVVGILLNYSNGDKIPCYGNRDKTIIEECNECTNRLSALEPEEPINIDSYPIYNLPFPTQTYPISEVLQKGKEIPLQFAFNNLNWKRPVYKFYWHTVPAGGRFSYVPDRVNYALHRIFATYPTASILFDLEGNLGIVEESKDFEYDISNIDQILLITMQSNIRKVVTLGNQVIVIVEPRRTGLQVLIIPENTIQPSNKDEATIFQMITPDGYEIDYFLMQLKD